MKGRKGSIDEGGLRSPCFMRWPEHIRAGVEISPIAGAIDLLPTLTELAGVEPNLPKPIDGKSLCPLLLGETVDLGTTLAVGSQEESGQRTVAAISLGCGWQIV